MATFENAASPVLHYYLIWCQLVGERLRVQQQRPLPGSIVKVAGAAMVSRSAGNRLRGVSASSRLARRRHRRCNPHLTGAYYHAAWRTVLSGVSNSNRTIVSLSVGRMGVTSGGHRRLGRNFDWRWKDRPDRVGHRALSTGGSAGLLHGRALAAHAALGGRDLSRRTARMSRYAGASCHRHGIAGLPLVRGGGGVASCRGLWDSIYAKPRLTVGSFKPDKKGRLSG